MPATSASARLQHPDGAVRATAVFAHYFTCSKDLRAARRLGRAPAERGIAVLSFDLPDSVERRRLRRHDLLRRRRPGRTLEAPSLLIGHSLGGAAVLTAAAVGRAHPAR
jgi:predicted alpha/beta-hydrolase family hydrolase